MRCVCCNKNLNDWESTVKHADTGEYLDTCRSCLDGLDIPTLSRPDLEPFEQMGFDDFDIDTLKDNDE